MQVAFQSTPLCKARLDDACARCRQLLVGLGALQCESDEFREVGETLLRFGAEVLRTRREDEQRAPETGSGGDRSNHRRPVARAARHRCGLTWYVVVVVDAAALVRGAV